MSKDKCPSDYRNFGGTNQIFNPYNNSDGCEMSNPIHDIEKNLVREIARIIVEALDIGWQDREHFKRLLYTAINSEVGKLLRQYQDFSVDYIGKEINKRFDIDEEVEFGHALHAKLNNHFRKLLEMTKVSDPVEPDEPTGYVMKEGTTKRVKGGTAGTSGTFGANDH